jgi:cellulose biosynthesis protein BcsQ
MFKVAIYSPKGGVGKTSVTLLLSVASAIEGKKVVAVDLDPIRDLTRRLLYLNVSENIEHGVVEFLTNDAKSEPDVIDVINNLKLVPMERDSKKVSTEDLMKRSEKLMNWLESSGADLAFIDLPAGMNANEVKEFMCTLGKHGGYYIIPVTNDIPSIQSVEDELKVWLPKYLEGCEKKPILLGVLANVSRATWSSEMRSKIEALGVGLTIPHVDPPVFKEYIRNKPKAINYDTLKVLLKNGDVVRIMSTITSLGANMVYSEMMGRLAKVAPK